MAASQCIDRLGGWIGYEVEAQREERRGGVLWCVMRLRPRRRCCVAAADAGVGLLRCMTLKSAWVRDLPIFEVPVELVVPRLRLACPACGPKLEHLSWLEPYSRVTVRLAIERGKAVQGHVDSARGGLLWSELEHRQAHRSSASGARTRTHRVRRRERHCDGRVRHPEGTPLRHGHRRAVPQARAVGRARPRASGRTTVLRSVGPSTATAPAPRRCSPTMVHCVWRCRAIATGLSSRCSFLSTSDASRALTTRSWRCTRAA